MTGLTILLLNLRTLAKQISVSQIDPNSAGQWLTLVIRNFGVPGALFLVFALALHKGWIRLGREWEEPKGIREAYEARIKDINDSCTSRLREQDGDYEKIVAHYEERIRQERQMAHEVLASHVERNKEQCADYEKRLQMMREDRQKYLDLVIRSTNLGERMVVAAEKTVDQASRISEKRSRPDI